MEKPNEYHNLSRIYEKYYEYFLILSVILLLLILFFLVSPYSALVNSLIDAKIYHLGY